MARPQKNGLDYFPLNVDIFEDEKIEAIAGEFGIKGELLVIKLLCAVYRKGYYVVWNDLLKMQLLKRIPGASRELLDQVVNRLVAWGVFDKALFNSDMVLTSVRIQETFKEATKRRKEVDMSSYCLINVDINEQASEINDDINPQSKVKETKENNNSQNSAGGGNKKALQEDFEKLWKLYPRKERKNDAFKAYVKAIKSGVSNKTICNGIVNYQKHIIANKIEPRFIKQGGTWFNKECWNDEYAVPQQTNTTKQQSVFEKMKMIYGENWNGVDE
ncbi:DUF4373 domain-containing protein [Granulicatella adiacens]